MPKYTVRKNEDTEPENSKYENRKEELKEDEYNWSMDTFERCWATAMKLKSHYKKTKNGQVRRLTDYTINKFLDDYATACDRLKENAGVSKTRRTEQETKALIRGRKSYIETAYNAANSKYGDEKEIEFPNFEPATGGGFEGNVEEDFNRRQKLLKGADL